MSVRPASRGALDRLQVLPSSWDDGALTSHRGSAVTALTIPAQQFRVGFFTSPSRSIEPTLAVNFVRVEGDNFSQIVLGLGVLFHMTPDRTRSQTYFRPFAGISTVSGGGASDTGARLGLGFGIKSPLVPRLSSRLEAFVAHQFDDDDQTSIGVLFGLSFFPR